MNTLVKELHKPARRNYVRRKTLAYGNNDLWQADLVEMIPYHKQNKGYKYLLTQIDVYNKFARAVPVKSKSAHDVSLALHGILKEESPRNLHTDQGTEFFNAKVKSLMKKYNINHYYTYSELKASVVERFNRTLKSLMWKEFTRRGNYKWIDILPEIIEKYNNTIHSTIKLKPVDAKRLNKNKNNFPIKKVNNPKFKVGDKVRISHVKKVFDKGYLQNWSNEVFTVTRILKTTPVVTYKISDEVGEVLQGSFYEQELQKTKVPNFYLIEKVIRKKIINGKSQYLVKWKGYDAKYNSWVDNITKLG